MHLGHELTYHCNYTVTLTMWWLLAAASQPLMTAMDSAAISDICWAVARLQYNPADDWLQQLVSAINLLLPSMAANHLAIIIWAVTRMGLKPDRGWLLAFKSKVICLHQQQLLCLKVCVSCDIQ